MMVVAQILTLALLTVRWGLLVVFGFWLYRRLPLRSLPWAGAYSLLVLPGLAVFNGLLVHKLVGKQTLPLDWFNSMSPAIFYALVNMWSRVFSTAAALILTIIILSDVVFVLSRAGIEPDKKAVRRLLVIRDWSTPLGVAVIVLTLISQLLALAIMVLI